MKKHKCKPSKICICNLPADGPNEKCPVHRIEWPPRCYCYCGKFVKYKKGWEK